jgi:hypothetical protein
MIRLDEQEITSEFANMHVAGGWELFEQSSSRRHSILVEGKSFAPIS